ncbi:MAG: TIGR02281 family clan AA aspartic protease [Pseudomonadota bacterium]
MAEEPSDTRRFGAVMIILTWIAIIGLITVAFTDVLKRQENPNQTVVSQTGADGVRAVILERNRFGQYLANGEINGRSVRFLVDTGATAVALSDELAGDLGLRRGQPVRISTANGQVLAHRTRLDAVGLGDLVIHNVEAIINPGQDGGDVLLGMSFLEQTEFTQRGKTLIIKPMRP